MTDHPLSTPNEKSESSVAEAHRDAALADDADLRRDALDYIVQLSAELATLARSSRFELVAYLLDMAATEAGGVRRKLTR